MNPAQETRSIWAARLEVVGELASLINTTFDLDEIFRAAIVKLRRVLEFRRASVALVSDGNGHYYLHTLFDEALGGFVAAEGSFPISRGLTGRVIGEGKAIRVDAFGGTEGIRTRGEQSVSVIIVPLHVDDRVIGTLNLGAKESASYDDEDLELAVLLGRQISTSLHYSKLLATIRDQREALAEKHARVESEHARLEALIGASDAAVLMVSDGRVAYTNQVMAELLGLPREVVLGSPVEEVHRVLGRSFEDPAMLQAQVVALQGAESLHDRVEFHFPRKLICQRTVAAARGETGEVLGHLILFRDVTREAEAEALKSEFVSLVSHELRTPLTSVKTSLNLLLRGAAGTISEAMQDLLDIALRNLDRLIRLVDDLLDLSRIESGRVVTRTVPILLQDAVARAVDAVAGFAAEREVRIEVDGGDADISVLADADRLQQVVVNLVSNAVKFSPPQGCVGLRWWQEAAGAVVEISDQGPGIPQEQLEVIFDKFRQLEQAATRKYGGAGLGLAISRTIMQQMGGQLWAESEEGKGSRFFARLKLAGEAGAGESAASSGVAAASTLLLLVRDPDLRRLLQAHFEGERWQVAAMARGSEALARVREGGIGLIAVGSELEDMHGLEFVQRLRDLPEAVDVPALLFGPGGDHKRATTYGADGWVPGDADELLSQANRLVAAPRRRVILLIEDDPAVRTGVSRGLRRAGYACLEASSGEVGLELAHQRTPDLILTDVHIPGRDGLDVLRAVRADEQLAAVPAIVVTGHATPEMAKTINTLHAHFLPKPFGIASVLQEVERLIGPPAA